MEITVAEHKTEEKKEAALDYLSMVKPSTLFDKFVRRVWYKRPISDEGDATDETENRAADVDLAEKKAIVPDIDTSHTMTAADSQIASDSNAEKAEEGKPAPIPTWLNDQVYGDKVRRSSRPE